jgi:hypothetical protein
MSALAREREQDERGRTGPRYRSNLFTCLVALTPGGPIKVRNRANFGESSPKNEN